MLSILSGVKRKMKMILQEKDEEETLTTKTSSDLFHRKRNMLLLLQESSSSSSSLMDIVEKHQQEENNAREFLPLIKTKFSHNYTTQTSLLLTNDIANNPKGVCTSCVLTPLQSDKINSNYTIKEKGETSTRFCVICNDFKPAREMEEAGKCNHYFCVECIKDYLSKILKESGTLQVECPEKNCKKILSNYFHSYLPRELMERCMVSEVEARVLASRKFVHCPFYDCCDRFVDDMKNYSIRACPTCWRVFCMRCKDECHMGISCNKNRFSRRSRRKKTRSSFFTYY